MIIFKILKNEGFGTKKRAFLRTPFILQLIFKSNAAMQCYWYVVQLKYLKKRRLYCKKKECLIKIFLSDHSWFWHRARSNFSSPGMFKKENTLVCLRLMSTAFHSSITCKNLSKNEWTKLKEQKLHLWPIATKDTKIKKDHPSTFSRPFKDFFF